MPAKGKESVEKEVEPVVAPAVQQKPEPPSPKELLLKSLTRTNATFVSVHRENLIKILE